MGMPSINITFTELAKSVIERGGSKNVGLIIPAVSQTGTLILGPGDSIPDSIPQEHREQIELAMIGGEEKPKKIIVHFAGESFSDIDTELEKMQDENISYLAMSGTGDGVNEKVIAFIKTNREAGGTMKAVLANQPADHEGIINFASYVTKDEKEYSAEKYCSRIAGLLAGTPITSSCTYFSLPELSDCSRLSKDDADRAIDSGKLIVFYDSGDVRIARAVNSFQTITGKKGDQYKKIKIVDVMDTIATDIKKTIHDEWIGKKVNTYDNKCLLVSAIQGYFSDLVDQGVLSGADVEVDIDANKKYLKSVGIDTADMSYEEIKRANTGEEVFLVAAIKIVDAIEDITIQITI